MPVNGADQSHLTVPAPPPPIENLEGPIELPEDLRLKLKEPLPPAAVSPNPIKPGLSAIKVIYVVERLNDVFGLNGWHVDNEIVETGSMVVVRATLSIPKFAIAIEQFGGNDNPDRGDAYKGACTDALSKCASYLGIGMDVYKGLNDTRPQGSAGWHNTSHAASVGKAQQTSNRAAGGNSDLMGLTTRNMGARFSAMRSVLGVEAYEAILGQHGYSEVTTIPSIDDARQVYKKLLDSFRIRFGEALRAIGRPGYTNILRQLRLNPRARLNPDLAVRVFNRMQETLNAKE